MDLDISISLPRRDKPLIIRRQGCWVGVSVEKKTSGQNTEAFGERTISDQHYHLW